jgi:hypothetical protein
MSVRNLVGSERDFFMLQVSAFGLVAWTERCSFDSSLLVTLRENVEVHRVSILKMEAYVPLKRP